MRIKFLAIIFLISVTGCKTNHSGIESCFENIESRIGSDSIIKNLSLVLLILMEILLQLSIGPLQKNQNQTQYVQEPLINFYWRIKKTV